nr:protein SPA1-RELATED 2 [Ipomoea trifida]
MDESVGDEVNEMAVVDGALLRSKESGYSSKLSEHGIQESHEVVGLDEGDHHENPAQYFIDILDGRSMDRIGSSGHASSSPRCMDDSEVMVRELTLKNYNGENLAMIGAPGNRERVQTRPNNWKTLYQIAGGSGKGSLHREATDKDQSSTLSNLFEGEEDRMFTEFLEQNQKSTNESHNLVTGNSQSNDNKSVSNDILLASGGIRTKILSKSGFSEYFIKSTLKGKGTIQRGPTTRALGREYLDHTHSDRANISLVDSSGADSVLPPSITYQDGVSLREWLKARRNKLSKAESLSIFKQIVDLVDSSHSQGIILQDLWPSCFKLLQSNQVVYLGTSMLTDPTENVMDRDVPEPEQNYLKRPLGNIMHTSVNPSVKKLKLGDPVNITTRWPQFPSRSGIRSAPQNTNADFAWPRGSGSDLNEVHKHNSQSKFSSSELSRSPQPLQTSVSFMLEAKWYTSPEQLNKGGCTFSSNIYCLGVLFFELLGFFESGRSHAAAMQDLCHRILPPSFLSENPKEAGFCLWLLHPEPSSRPTTREILQSEIMGGKKESGDEMLSSIIEEDSESELLAYFFSLLKEQKQNDASKLVEEIKCIEADIQEVQKRQTKQSSVSSTSCHESLAVGRSRYVQIGGSSSTTRSKLSPVYNDDKKLKNIQQLESAYFSMRSNIRPSSNDAKIWRKGEILKNREDNFLKGVNEEMYERSDGLGGFFDGLCKYARYSKFRVRGVLRNGEFNNSANVICSLSFDRDEEYIATGGVSKKIKIYEYNALFNDSVDIHYPVLEMSNNSKLSCICWNSYIRNYLATTDYDGVVKLWDATTGQGFFNFSEHNERAWSVDFSRVDPTKLVSGSDDRLKNSICTIRNNANVCCVQFSPYSGNFLSYSSADYRTYCYDLRNVSTPWRILVGHEKAVSYAKFLDAETLISASTDNTLKIWDLNKTSSNALSTDSCILTLRGHTNEKVFAYYKSQPMPITSYKFGSIDPISGKETDDDVGQQLLSLEVRSDPEEAAADKIEFQKTKTKTKNMAVNSKTMGLCFIAIFAVVIAAVTGVAHAHDLAPAPAPASNGATIDQGVACALMLLALGEREHNNLTERPLTASDVYGPDWVLVQTLKRQATTAIYPNGCHICLRKPLSLLAHQSLDHSPNYSLLDIDISS